MASVLKPSWVLLTKTAGDDNAFRLAEDSVLLIPCDIFVTSNDAYMGDAKNQGAEIFAGDIYSAAVTTPVDVSQLWFKNRVAGSNTVVTITGVSIPG